VTKQTSSIMVTTSTKVVSNTSKSGKGSKMQNLIDYRVRITMNDGRQLTGLLMAFDKFMNLVLADTEEFRRIKRRSTTKSQTDSTEQEEKRTLGLVILRGEQVISLSVDAAPVTENAGRLAPIQSGFGTAKPVGRGLPIIANAASAPPGLSGPVRGLGGGFGRGFAPPMTGAPPGMPLQNQGRMFPISI
jgi:small nuclear ribonucleoprotein B and B'